MGILPFADDLEDVLAVFGEVDCAKVESKFADRHMYDVILDNQVIGYYTVTLMDDTPISRALRVNLPCGIYVYTDAMAEIITCQGNSFELVRGTYLEKPLGQSA
jgi:hypothetical protein